jgi:hypothetical protein
VTGRAVYAEREAALSLAHFSLIALGRTDDEADMVIDSLRGAPTRPTETFATLASADLDALIRSSEAKRMRRRSTAVATPPQSGGYDNTTPTAGTEPPKLPPRAD